MGYLHKKICHIELNKVAHLVTLNVTQQYKVCFRFCKRY